MPPLCCLQWRQCCVGSCVTACALVWVCVVPVSVYVFRCMKDRNKSTAVPSLSNISCTGRRGRRAWERHGAWTYTPTRAVYLYPYLSLSPYISLCIPVDIYQDSLTLSIYRPRERKRETCTTSGICEKRCVQGVMVTVQHNERS